MTSCGTNILLSLSPIIFLVLGMIFAWVSLWMWNSRKRAAGSLMALGGVMWFFSWGLAFLGSTGGVCSPFVEGYHFWIAGYIGTHVVLFALYFIGGKER